MAATSTDPQVKSVLESLALMNLEGEGIEDVRKWIRDRLLQQGVLQPTEEEAAQMAEAAKNQAPDPQSEYLEAAAKNQLAQAEAKTLETQASADLKAAQVEETKAKAAQALASIEAGKIDRILQMLEQLAPQQNQAQLAEPTAQ
jgi:hypothetical protein